MDEAWSVPLFRYLISNDEHMTSADDTSMQGTVVVLTGASSGIGAAGARELADRGATVAVVGRNEARTRDVALQCGPKATAFVADFASLASVQTLGASLLEKYPNIDVLINNAGFIAGRFERTVDGIESTMAVNHVAPFLLTQLLSDRLRTNPSGRVITTSSVAHASARLHVEDLDGERSWRAFKAYSQSKLANVLFTRELARRWPGVAVNCFHPGVVDSGFGNSNPLLKLFMPVVRLVLIGPEKGARTMVQLASSTATGANAVTGEYWVRGKVSKTSNAGNDMAVAARLWERTEELVAPFL